MPGCRFGSQGKDLEYKEVDKVLPKPAVRVIAVKFGHNRRRESEEREQCVY
jgi:hypothetical protein